MLQRLNTSGQFCASLLLLALLCNCAGLPKLPQTPLALFDNTSKDEKTGRDYSKSPAFHVTSHSGVEFEIPWNSPDADNMVCTPFKDYAELNAYYKKLFDVMERELLNRASMRKR